MVEKRVKRPQEETPFPEPLVSEPLRLQPAPVRTVPPAPNSKQTADSGRSASTQPETTTPPASQTAADAPAQPAAPLLSTSPRLARLLAASRRSNVAIRPATGEEYAGAAQGNSVPERIVREGDFSAIPAFMPLGDSRMAGYASEIALDWLPSIVGEAIASRLSLTPATLCAFSETDDMSAGQIFLELQMIGSLGGYLTGTNAIVIPPEVLAYSEADALHVVLHEELHYASWLGGGKDIRWMDEGGNPRFQGSSRAWSMHEGVTELTAQEVVRERGFEPTHIGYPAEVITCYYMEQLLGEGGRDILRSAYLSGDFTQVRRLVDAQLGAGTFDALISKPDAAQALSYLTGRIDESGIDHSSWDANPIITAARTKLEEAR